jgi:hypothetical protein
VIFAHKDMTQFLHPTLIKNKIKFSSYILGNSEGSGAKSYMTNDLLIYGGEIYDFASDPV